MFRTRAAVGLAALCGMLCGGAANAGGLTVKDFKMPTDALSGHVLTSDASGVGTWQSLPPVGAHTHLGEAWSGAASYGLRVTTSSVGGCGLEGYGAAEGANGVYEESSGQDGVGVEAFASAVNGVGVWAGSTGTRGIGVAGWVNAPTGTGYGVLGIATSATAWAGFFDGHCHTTGDLSCNGTLSKGSGTFKIDHPLDPGNKYLYHSLVESPDMMNVYNGNVAVDEKGEAWVALPEWFEALNRDFRYQLTCIGAFAPVHVATEISGNRFKIAGGKPGMKVSWQVTGIRKDPFANANRVVAEVDKAPNDRGYYLHAEAYGLPKDKSLAHRRSARRRAIAQAPKLEAEQ